MGSGILRNNVPSHTGKKKEETGGGGDDALATLRNALLAGENGSCCGWAFCEAGLPWRTESWLVVA